MQVDLPNKRYIENINGWEICQRCIGSPAMYYVMKRGTSVHTSKDLNYIRKLAKERKW